MMGSECKYIMPILCVNIYMTAIFRDTEIYFQLILFVDSSAVRAFPLVAHSCAAFSADIWLAGLVEIAAQGIIVEGYEQRIAYIVECCKAEHDIADGADTAQSAEIQDGIGERKDAPHFIHCGYGDNQH